MVSCISVLSYCGGKLTAALLTVCFFSWGWAVTWRGHLTGHKENSEPAQRKDQSLWMEVRLSSTTFFACFHFRYTVFIFSKEKRGCPTSTYYTCTAHIAPLHWESIWLLTTTVPDSHPVLSEPKHRLLWDFCQICKYVETPVWMRCVSIWQLSCRLI